RLEPNLRLRGVYGYPARLHQQIRMGRHGARRSASRLFARFAARGANEHGRVCGFRRRGGGLMARVGRLAGALLAETEGRYFLVGNTKEPCDFRALGIEPPSEIDALKRPFLPLAAAKSIALGPTWLALGLEGEPLAERLAACFVIRRTGS